MNTNLKLIERALVLLSKTPTPLEVALDNATEFSDLVVNDDYKVIREFLREKGLIEHNPRLTLIGKYKAREAKIGFEHIEVHPDFHVDHITERCEKLITNCELLKYLEEK